MNQMRQIFAAGVCLLLAACGDTTGETGTGGSSTGGSGGSGATGGSSSTGGAPNACALAADTTATDTVNTVGCHVLDRDTSACEASRKAAGLSGFWLDFSCRVTLTTATEGGVMLVKAASDDQPDYASNYFPAGDTCHEEYPNAIQNPNKITAQSFSIGFPVAPSGAPTTMKGTAVVGIALNGVVIFGNFAAPGDDIFTEAKTFDRCGAHPQMSGIYHYHSEPYSISFDDDRFIGVMRDGYPIYGRKDQDGTYPTLDADGGHMGTTLHSNGASVYHYHVNEQTSTTAQSLGEKQWFLTTGTFHGAPAACAGCK